MSLLKKMKERVAEEKLIGSHPLMKMSVERNVRDAYFQGLVFAAFADDDQVDEYTSKGHLIIAAQYNRKGHQHKYYT